MSWVNYFIEMTDFDDKFTGSVTLLLKMTIFINIGNGMEAIQLVESIKNTSMEDVSTRELDKNKEYLRR